MLIAVAGLAGAGKTTAVEHLQGRGFGEIIYVGDYVLAEVRTRGLAVTPTNERLVRKSLREEFGMDTLARRALDDIRRRQTPATILLDAICVREECECYRRALGSSVVVLGVDASFEVRAARVAARVTRPLTAGQLRERDLFERRSLRLDEVVTAADHYLSNERAVEDFTRALDALAVEW